MFSRHDVLSAFKGGLGLGLLGSGLGLAQAYAPAQVNVHRAHLPGLNTPLRVALLSDLHYGRFIGLPQVRAWVSRALTTRADVILVLGDLVELDLRRSWPDDFLNELARLQAPLGVFGIWGNHDYGSFGVWTHPPEHNDKSWSALRDEFHAALARRGLRVLRNEGLLLRPDLYLGGVDDLYWGHPDAEAALRNAPEPVDAARLLMSHNPDYLMHLPPTVGLVLSGHTHGGQVRLPIIGAPVAPSEYGQRFAQGWVRGGLSGDGARGFVSRGLGLTGLPFRNLCTSEIVVLDLQPEAAR
ncbi:metallophosphoesterase [Deinococcus irradiatisoli]|uniref:Metallophosphoesterase n=1 Tax=Deinococcus irradiatisoli TaxID=2202254 RepID=A0A2Z3JS35_9DEIO|nr:metallophosphoesterase [Deinococcus irradiatisoli]AWN23564.1 metallophosphoesterase [Deinococcus irradiatisoli]